MRPIFFTSADSGSGALTSSVAKLFEAGTALRFCKASFQHGEFSWAFGRVQAVMDCSLYPSAFPACLLFVCLGR